MMKILFGVFDWGLGHATRDYLIIEELLRRENKVDIISTGRALKVLRKRFGKRCRYFDVPSIHPPYTKSRFFTISFIKNIPKMSSTLKKARKITEKIIGNGKYDKIISDCRYDVYDTKENSYLINHQVRFKSLPVAQVITEFWLAKRMNKYRYILVPDFEEENLTGKLSHNLRFVKKSKIRYVGILSHIKMTEIKKDIDYFISLSGPEPQRTILEEKVISQCKKLKGKIVIAAANPERNDEIIKNNNVRIEIFGFLESKKQQEFMNRAKFVITRSGYTTVMELCELGVKKALLIPTPGQTEQEYLADLYEKRSQFHHVSQNKLNLEDDIKKAEKFSGFSQKGSTKDSVKNIMRAINE